MDWNSGIIIVLAWLMAIPIGALINGRLCFNQTNKVRSRLKKPHTTLNRAQCGMAGVSFIFSVPFAGMLNEKGYRGLLSMQFEGGKGFSLEVLAFGAPLLLLALFLLPGVFSIIWRRLVQAFKRPVDSL